ncbi:hypothetical protein [Magnetospirillum sp. 64-120]|uniref:hypothetical protein n=1 Tax=Magnetospirillum sp. 64-120 TaxID=1895778 RepID=UPI00092951EF|nr:hypothetical protein [Magnetospirillum sp. 64-120]OJX81779.1 MAG: hypothetical protein BGO92_15700 [Magnetospirillum sp. 64-120]
MAELMLTPITENEIGARNVFNTGVSTVGKGGHDYFCGHCGRKMIHNMDLSKLETPVVYQCGGCGSYNLAPEIETTDETA